MDIHQLKEPLLVHKAQAMCYAYMICETENPAFITVQVTVLPSGERETPFSGHLPQ